VIKDSHYIHTIPSVVLDNTIIVLNITIQINGICKNENKNNLKNNTNPITTQVIRCYFKLE
jgi:hypothetical protein